jgi:hypothetical protein
MKSNRDFNQINLIVLNRLKPQFNPSNHFKIMVLTNNKQ